MLTCHGHDHFGVSCVGRFMVGNEATGGGDKLEGVMQAWILANGGPTGRGGNVLGEL